MKKEPALRVSGSPGLSTMPLRARILSTAERTSPTPARSPMCDAELGRELGVLHRRRQRVASAEVRRNVTARADRVTAPGLLLLKRLVR